MEAVDPLAFAPKAGTTAGSWTRHPPLQPSLELRRIRVGLREALKLLA